jgi:hypothetical protein
MLQCAAPKTSVEFISLVVPPSGRNTMLLNLRLDFAIRDPWEVPFKIKCYLSHVPNTTGVDITVKFLLTSPIEVDI